MGPTMTRPIYDEEAATLAWNRTLAHFAKYRP